MFKIKDSIGAFQHLLDSMVLLKSVFQGLGHLYFLIHHSILNNCDKMQKKYLSKIVNMDSV